MSDARSSEPSGREGQLFARQERHHSGPLSVPHEAVLGVVEEWGRSLSNPASLIARSLRVEAAPRTLS